MIDHVTLAVTDLEKSRLFYEKAFAPLGYRLSFCQDGTFWAFDTGNGLFEIAQSGDKPPLTRVHVAFRAKNRAEVDAFHRAALEAGAGDNGAPALALNIPSSTTPASSWIRTATTSKP